MASTTSDALAKVTAFEAAGGGSDWLHITRSSLVTGLRDRLANPNNIDTRHVNLCGPGAFFRCLAIDDPVMYADAVINLWLTNKALIGKREFKAGSSLRLAAPGATEPVDWVPLASLRDDENTFVRYDSTKGDLSGLTMPAAMVKWFTEAGYSDVKNVTNVVFTKDLENLQRADRLRAQGYRVCLLINSDMLKTATQSDHSFFPDHWVVLTDPVRVADGRLTTKVQSWGGIMPIPAAGGVMSASTFQNNYYGYVAAKPG
jgi:hypothetical protein